MQLEPQPRALRVFGTVSKARNGNATARLLAHAERQQVLAERGLVIGRLRRERLAAQGPLPIVLTVSLLVLLLLLNLLLLLLWRGMRASVSVGAAPDRRRQKRRCCGPRAVWQASSLRSSCCLQQHRAWLQSGQNAALSG